MNAPKLKIQKIKQSELTLLKKNWSVPDSRKNRLANPSSLLRLLVVTQMTFLHRKFKLKYLQSSFHNIYTCVNVCNCNDKIVNCRGYIILLTRTRSLQFLKCARVNMQHIYKAAFYRLLYLSRYMQIYIAHTVLVHIRYIVYNKCRKCEIQMKKYMIQFFSISIADVFDRNIYGLKTCIHYRPKKSVKLKK